MEYLYFAIFFIVILIPPVLGMIIPIYKSHGKVTGEIINYNSTMRKFVYKINLSSHEIIDLLNIKNDVDELSCTFDFDKSVIRFSEYGSHIDYYFQIQECGGFSILRLEQVALIGMQSYVPYKLNPFIVSKLRAEIIPFSQYGF
ncbi:MAG: hypothetical protein IJX37_00370 [Oscillospiraceae bacterium]|nr:hypothetical protein [Oscillospiraceae bacterium]